jgi:hypothetical protein
MNPRQLAALSLVLAVGLVACDDAETTLSTGSTVLSVPEGTTTPTTATTISGDAPTTTLRGQPVTDYEIVARLSTANGEVLHVVIPAGAYTDVDLENFVIDLKESDPDLWGAEVFDHPDAPAAFSVPTAQRTPEQQDLVDRHHLVSLVQGETIRFQGPFAEFGETVIGS